MPDTSLSLTPCSHQWCNNYCICFGDELQQLQDLKELDNNSIIITMHCSFKAEADSGGRPSPISECGLSIVSMASLSSLMAGDIANIGNVDSLVSNCAIETHSVRARGAHSFYNASQKQYRLPAQHATIHWTTTGGVNAKVRSLLHSVRERYPGATITLVTYAAHTERRSLSDVFADHPDTFQLTSFCSLQKVMTMSMNDRLSDEQRRESTLSVPMERCLSLAGVSLQYLNRVEEVEPGIFRELALNTPEQAWYFRKSASNTALLLMSLLVAVLARPRLYETVLAGLYSDQFDSSKVEERAKHRQEMSDRKRFIVRAFQDGHSLSDGRDENIFAILATFRSKEMDAVALSQIQNPEQNLERCFGMYNPKSITAITKEAVWLVFETEEDREMAMENSNKPIKIRDYNGKKHQNITWHGKEYGGKSNYGMNKRSRKLIQRELKFGGPVHSDAYKANVIKHRKEKKEAAAKEAAAKEAAKAAVYASMEDEKLYFIDE